ncbi:universal stress protein [Streptomyces sp. SID13031]|uniref:universal stress protein n=1 Tax=Streptomyces sp. SID13031 TaxID=2706046 RepID=UPI0013C883DF|nr:universal stress protein [Streptomyces sp. SID13031]NEA32379.1 universal stress protein [Streptomyces sp. SID13031]
MTATRRLPVVAGVDGSEASDTALGWAAAEAASRQVPLHLVHAFVWPLFGVPLGPSPLAPGLRAGAQQIADTATELAHKLEPDVTVETTVVDGLAFPVLGEQSRDAGLVVVGSRGIGPALSILVGSTGVDLAAYAHCPVVVVRPERDAPAGSTVVIGYDGSPASTAAFHFGRNYARRHGLSIRLVTVRSPGCSHHVELSSELVSPADRVPDEPPITIDRVVGHPAEQLLRLSADAQLVVVGSRGRGGFTGLLLGSVSQAVLHHSDCPVAVVR